MVSHHSSTTHLSLEEKIQAAAKARMKMKRDNARNKVLSTPPRKASSSKSINHHGERSLSPHDTVTTIGTDGSTDSPRSDPVQGQSQVSNMLPKQLMFPSAA